MSVQGIATGRLGMCTCAFNNANFILFVCISDLAPSVTVSVEGVDGATAATSQILTCSIGGVDISASAVTLVMYTWLRDGTVVKAASTSSQYTIPSGSVGVSNAGDVYTCRVAIAASYWDLSPSFGDSGGGILTVTSKSKWLPNTLVLHLSSLSTIQFLIQLFRALKYHLYSPNMLV